MTMPFALERTRIDKARAGLSRLQEFADTVVVIDNQRLMDLVPDLPLEAAFGFADEVLAAMVKGITETITMPSLINLDYADVRAIISNGGVALVGLGEASGPERVEDAIKNALSSPLLDVEWTGATGALIHITGGPDMSLAEANRVGELVSAKLSADATVIWGARVDPRLNGVLRVMLILTGVKSPQLLPRATEIHSTLRDSSRLTALGLGSGLSDSSASLVRARTDVRAIGKFPTSSRAIWEDRLKPIDRRSSDRKSNTTTIDESIKDISKSGSPKPDELGLKRILS